MFTIVKSIFFTFVNMEKYPKHLQQLMQEYPQIKHPEISGRYINLDHIRPALEKFSENYQIENIGKSVLGENVPIVKLGDGKTKILAWSQMHGNESTTTKAVFDILNAFRRKEEFPVLQQILKKCQIWIIPMLNPDGARSYTRINANSTDLNRDAQELKEVESRILREQFDLFSPDFCFNLHDQRTIYTAGNAPRPATLSFLTPSMDDRRQVFPSRKKSMKIIAAVSADLKEEMQGQIGRYDDAFNHNCTGDTFQTMEVPTILFEAGHYQGDYQREITRKYVFAALVSALHYISSEDYLNADYHEYGKIPENQKLYHDIILRKVRLDGGIYDVALQYREELRNKKIKFTPVVKLIDKEIKKFGLQEFDCRKEEVFINEEDKVRENVVVNKIILKEEEIDLKPE
ncbi:M14 family zinc carboxypeptidase [Autumnicola musiva]|uniref:M14 family zinc carboxypeptidase n=1 Tax=Autumnicola musiva TaxID=3075589 RepID=A0ABU3D5R6_9FLAO|nr:M14 family zinc carboxypeptidase [Zunongwangia sp. F117]MDT0676875.1 M14 family zinc carboxypeptidase [Zunongwangia sp. F117]